MLDEYQASALQLEQFLPLQLDAVEQFLPLQLDAVEQMGEYQASVLVPMQYPALMQQMGEYPASALVPIQYPALSLDVVQPALVHPALVQQSSDLASVLLQPFERQLLQPLAFFLSWPPLRQSLEHSG